MVYYGYVGLIGKNDVYYIDVLFFNRGLARPQKLNTFIFFYPRTSYLR